MKGILYYHPVINLEIWDSRVPIDLLKLRLNYRIQFGIPQ